MSAGDKMMAKLKLGMKESYQSSHDALLEKSYGMRMNKEYSKLFDDLKAF
jgi:hypothetical protein